MRPVSELSKLAKVLTYRTRRLEAIARKIAQADNRDCAAVLTFLTVEALMTWANYCRSYYLSCTVLKARQIAGCRVSHARGAITDERSGLLEAIRELKPTALPHIGTGARIETKYEPTWHEKKTLLTLSRQMSFSNNSDIVSALSYPTSFMDDLPTVRNFFAHRCHGTARKVEGLAAKEYGIAQLHHPADLINKTLSGRAEPLIIEWLLDMRQIGVALCK